MAIYIDENGRTVKANNYLDAAEKLYGQSKGFGGCPTTYAHRHNGYADVKVYNAGDKIGTYYGVAAARPAKHILRRSVNETA